MPSAEADAFLLHEGRVLRGQIPDKLQGLITPVMALIEGIYRAFPNKARLILRSRIFYNYDLTPACLGMLRIAGKRWARLELNDFNQRIVQASLVLNYSAEISPISEDERLLGQAFSHDAVVPVLQGLAIRGLRNLHRYQSARAVSALILDENGTVIANAWNQNALIKIQHAEFNLIRSYWLRERRPLPALSRIYTSLEPCEMCAGIIQALCGDPQQFSIYFLKPELGPSARHSVLRSSSWKNYSIHSSVDAQEHIKLRSP